MTTRVAASAILLAAALLASSTAAAQEQPAAHVHTTATDGDGWSWSGEASGFFGFNHQQRKFTDFDQWESQNWLMAGGEHRDHKGRTLRVSTMWSLEPFTQRKIGSPQVFQTGETFRSAPLIDYQHPHDLIMGLGADYRAAAGRMTVVVGADVVGAPTIGPTAFMHRPSAAINPQAPLSHHYLDSTHITPGVVRGGVGAGSFLVEGSWFRGREPDDDRTDVDFGALDSYAARLSWTRGTMTAQISGARLRLPEATTPYDADRVTASIASSGSGRLEAWTAAFGQNREIHGNLEAYLFEAVVRSSARGRVYTRAESVAKDILDAGFHPRGVFHRHRQSQVGAFTVGYLQNLFETSAGTFGAGADVTGYAVPANLKESYGSPLSIHVFVRFARRWAPAAAAHVH